jgi:hypothetical protein
LPRNGADGGGGGVEEGAQGIKATFMVDMYISERGANFPTKDYALVVRLECSVISGGGGRRRRRRRGSRRRKEGKKDVDCE